MNKIVYFFTFLFSSSLLVAFLSCSSTDEVTGTEIGNPSTVSGRVYDNHGNAIPNAAVFLVTPAYNPILDSIPSIDSLGNFQKLKSQMATGSGSQRMTTFTNNKGEFFFDNVSPRTYNLFIVDSTINYIGFWHRIIVNEMSIDLGMREIRKIGHVIIQVPDSVFSSQGYISLPGTPFKKPIDSAGSYIVPIFFDSMNINYYSSFGDSLFAIVQNEFIPTINPGDTIDLTGTVPFIITPVIIENIGDEFPFSGALTQDTMIIRVTALGARIYKNGFLEIEYQFYEANEKKLSSWSADSNHQLQVSVENEYVVTCRIREKSDTSIVSDWATELSINPRRKPGFYME